MCSYIWPSCDLDVEVKVTKVNGDFSHKFDLYACHTLPVIVYKKVKLFAAEILCDLDLEVKVMKKSGNFFAHIWSICKNFIDQYFL